MTTPRKISRRDHLTFKGNLRDTRHGWLRLTPAYSIHQVADLLGAADKDAVVLDPFCGTGTTALVCAERGIPCDTTDINPFLVWFAEAKACAYQTADIDTFVAAASRVVAAMRSAAGPPPWVPSLHQIEKWWDSQTLAALGYALATIKGLEEDLPRQVCDLLKVTFCQVMMAHAHVSFGHQSMSFKTGRKQSETPAAGFFPEFADFFPEFADNSVAGSWERAVPVIAATARSPVSRQPRILLLDARDLSAGLEADRYTCVITSPPYPNRMSYIRELRPYMYWLGYLTDGRAAGQLDWQAIGGTWGCATSNLAGWAPSPGVTIPFDGFEGILHGIAGRSEVLARYVSKYFHDMVLHIGGLFRVVRPGGAVNYIVGNSKFYDVLLPVEQIVAALFGASGFADVSVQVTRKRTSKKELFEYVVSARKPPAARQKALAGRGPTSDMAGGQLLPPLVAAGRGWASASTAARRRSATPGRATSSSTGRSATR